MRYFSTFSGIGGFELGIIKAHENLGHRGIPSSSELAVHGDLSDTDASNGNGRRTDPVCVGFSEIDKYAIQIYQKHFPEHKNYGDITKINAEELPDFDLLVGGFPCQAFSIAGKRAGFEDTRGTLFFDLARILRAKRPRLFLFENVKGLLSHDDGKTFRTIIATLTELGYDLQWQVLNSKNHGVPQNRERVFIVGHLRGTSRPEVFPLRENEQPHILRDEEEQGREVAPAITVRNASGNNARGQYVRTDQPCLQQIRNLPDHSDSGGWEAHTSDFRIRRITPTECERLQGFPDGWTEGVSDTQRYKCLGNAVTVNAIQAICEKLLRS